jgi:hypothetical protein
MPGHLTSHKTNGKYAPISAQSPPGILIDRGSDEFRLTVSKLHKYFIEKVGLNVLEMLAHGNTW